MRRDVCLFTFHNPMPTRVPLDNPNVRVAVRTLRLVLTGICLYAVFAFVTARVSRQPYYQNFLVASLGIAAAMIVVMRLLGPAAGMAAGIVVVLVHFGLAWLGLVLTGGDTSRLWRDVLLGIVATVLVGIPYAVYVTSRPRDTGSRRPPPLV